MSRYIDKYALIESIKNTADLGGWIGEALYQIKQVAIKYIDSAPSIDIVRCKECKWRDDYGCHNPIWGDGWANYPPPSPRDDDFCSYGERKEK